MRGTCLRTGNKEASGKLSLLCGVCLCVLCGLCVCVGLVLHGVAVACKSPSGSDTSPTKVFDEKTCLLQKR